MTGDTITTWLHPLQQIIDPTGNVDWSRLACLDSELTALLETYPVGPALAAGLERSDRLLLIRQGMAARGFRSSSALFQLLAQFLCGYHDMDLRDTIGLGHGRLIAEYAPEQAQDRWMGRLNRGELAAAIRFLAIPATYWSTGNTSELGTPATLAMATDVRDTSSWHSADSLDSGIGDRISLR